MPPSPAMRCSPGRELRAENHKRGRSLESGIHLREKDDDLALFNEVQTRERDNFLLQSNDDLDDLFCKMFAIISGLHFRALFCCEAQKVVLSLICLTILLVVVGSN